MVLSAILWFLKHTSWSWSTRAGWDFQQSYVSTVMLHELGMNCPHSYWLRIVNNFFYITAKVHYFEKAYMNAFLTKVEVHFLRIMWVDLMLPFRLSEWFQSNFWDEGTMPFIHFNAKSIDLLALFKKAFCIIWKV